MSSSVDRFRKKLLLYAQAQWSLTQPLSMKFRGESVKNNIRTPKPRDFVTSLSSYMGTKPREPLIICNVTVEKLRGFDLIFVILNMSLAIRQIKAAHSTEGWTEIFGRCRHCHSLQPCCSEAMELTR
jgi:hypothetical protein